MPDVVRHQATAGRRSWLGYARILRSVHDEPLTTSSLAALHGMRQEGMRHILRRMLSLGLVHIAGTRPAANHLRMPVWGFGCGPTPPDLTSNRPKRAGIELITMATILRALAARPHSVAALAAAAGIDRERVGLLLRQMHGELRMVRIASYKSHRRIPGGVPAAQYMLGFDQPDAVRPAPTPVKVLYARQWAQKVAKRQRREAFERLAANAFVFTLAAGAEA